MFTMHPTVLVGPADWDPAGLPKDEFRGRTAAAWRALDPALAGLVVYGSPRHHAALAYLTHFTPKLEPAIALIPREGEPRLLVGGGANMLGAAKPLTWVETLLPLRDAGATIARWAGELAPGGLALVNGDEMPFGLRQNLAAALGAPPGDADGVLAAAMRRKSARELALVREACASLDAAFHAMRLAMHRCEPTTAVVLAGERAAWVRGAQDVRTLFGADGRLAPFTDWATSGVSPLQAYVAVRHDGYWAEGFVVMASGGRPIGHAARDILDHAIELVRPGAAHREVAQYVARAIGPGREHPLTRDSVGHGIGLALKEPDDVSPASDGGFAVGETYTLRVGLREGGSLSLQSAMLAITHGGHDVLWRGATA